MVGVLSALLERLNAGEIRYCHWKSNWILEDTLAAETDLDLLVERGDAQRFHALLIDLGFRPAGEPDSAPFPAVQHFLAMDEEDGVMVHVHAYFRIISGDSLTKNYRLPLEEMLLAAVRREGAVNVPSRGAELVVFVFRMFLKHVSLPELALLLRGWDDVHREATWLATKEARAEAARLLPVWLPGFSPALFESAVDALLAPAPLWRRTLLARRVRAQLRRFARRGRVRAWGASWHAVVSRGSYRIRGSRKRLTLTGGGAVIAFVGSEAAGKSTMLAEMERRLGRHLTVERVHAGKPPSTPLTVLPNLLLPAARALVPGQRSTRVAAQRHSASEREDSTGAFPLLFGLRSISLAHERRVLLTDAFASAANGRIVLCDRYPSVERGAPDGAQLGPLQSPSAVGRVKRWLVDLETRLYRAIPPPDVVIYLTAPLETTLERNRAREKTEPEDYVRQRHTRGSRLTFDPVVDVKRVDTDRPLDESIAEINRIVWHGL